LTKAGPKGPAFFSGSGLLFSVFRDMTVVIAMSTAAED
jgi:hypothetical protein